METHKTVQRSAFGIVSGLGSGKTGTQYWLHQRVTSVALIFLSLWVVYAFAYEIPHKYPDVLAWFKHPIHITLILLTVLIGLYHGVLGLQVIIEDYVHRVWLKFFLLYLMKFMSVLLAISSIIALFNICSMRYA